MGLVEVDAPGKMVWLIENQFTFLFKSLDSPLEQIFIKGLASLIAIN